MKKFLSLMLAGLMSASLFVVGAAAETTKTGVVGGADGVVDFTSVENKDNNINVKVNNVTHKYAVDLTFKFDDLTLGNLTWNVNDMRYDVDEAMENTTREIVISNRSDNPVYAYAVAKDSDTADHVTPTVDKYFNAENKLTVAKAQAGTTGSTGEEGKGTATAGTLTVKLDSANWNNVAEYYSKKKEADPDTLAYTLTTVTVYISKD